MAKRKLRVGVLFGGRSAEHEVSLVSAASVMANLNRSRYEVVPIGITKDGHWLAGPAAHELLTQGAHIPASLRVLVPPEPQKQGLIPLRSPKKALQRLDCLFPVLHGTYGEDGTIQGLLELTGIPYVGAGVLGSAVGMDKIVQKQLYDAAGLPTPPSIYFTSASWPAGRLKISRDVRATCGYPCFVKPANLGSSVGITKVHKPRELSRAVRLAMRYDRRIIVEQAIENAWEIECAVLGNDSPRASLAGQIIPSNEFYDYDAKYVDGKSRAVIPAPLPPHVMRRVRELAVAAFKLLDLAGMARVDFLVQPRGWRVYLNEVNTIPGFTSISMYPKLWAASGLPYPRLLGELIRLALARSRAQRQRRTTYRPKDRWYQSS